MIRQLRGCKSERHASLILEQLKALGGPQVTNWLYTIELGNDFANPTIKEEIQKFVIDYRKRVRGEQ